MQNKKGFTLIELMVVVVIIGILAAVAVPKLFGMIAKSKASEVGPAAGTYVKLQNAYVSEAGTNVGSWPKIGYIGPGTKDTDIKTGSTNFTYTDEATYTNDTVSLPGLSGHIGWQAENIAKLNDCAASSTWQEVMGAGSSAGEVTYLPTYSDEANCGVLTPSFKNIK
jgi:prepilin-type N-terminal cleavage/methylation domain-containing protein